ncbi:response regulator transcription factor [Streptomyces sp. MST-110588]|uniref:response regulator transcription factor n=1 Tax=Streptomyces sp. MST-110588 TaxID=2833628 RepID=UPI001F5CEAE7|nr:response regulator transcription factor [Streptomyces sp. MST-110588]UNO38371.1 response regulator transcription factor [Streptomyces sp. MST-110588]
MTVRLLLADDQAVTRAGFRVLLSESPGLSVIGEADGPDEVLDTAGRLKPDVVLLNLRALNRTQLALLTKRLRCPGCAPDSAVVIVKAPENSVGFAEALAAGGSGCVAQDAARQALVNAVMLVSEGGVVCLPGEELRALLEGPLSCCADDPVSWPSSVASLTEREIAVLALLGRGLTNSEMAAELHLAVTTVKKHLAGALQKIDEPSRVRAALFASRHRLDVLHTARG